MIFSYIVPLDTIFVYNMFYRFSKSLWRSVPTSLIVRAASVTTTHCVAGVLWSTGVLGGPSVRIQQSQWDGYRTPVSASQPQSPPASLSWMTLRLWVFLSLQLTLYLHFTWLYTILQLSVTVTPGLPPLLTNESYQCQFADRGRLRVITVDAEEVTPNTVYQCNITGRRVPTFTGVQLGKM